ncbi:hypothetical protein CB1_000844041 [Camelus ferus]|nr:hypothetical protein CB1_000844041 [Camelus ferus]
MGSRVYPKPTVKLRRWANKSVTRIPWSSDGEEEESGRDDTGNPQQIIGSFKGLLGQQSQGEVASSRCWTRGRWAVITVAITTSDEINWAAAGAELYLSLPCLLAQSAHLAKYDQAGRCLFWTMVDECILTKEDMLWMLTTVLLVT